MGSYLKGMLPKARLVRQEWGTRIWDPPQAGGYKGRVAAHAGALLPVATALRAVLLVAMASYSKIELRRDNS